MFKLSYVLSDITRLKANQANCIGYAYLVDQIA